MKKKPNIAKAVEQALRGLPDKITVYMPWDTGLDEPGLWEDWEGDVINQFPCLFNTRKLCEKEIAEFAIDTLEAVIRGDMSLPEDIDYARKYTLHRNGNMLSGEGYPHTMFELVSDREGSNERFTKQTFNREFAHYYAGLVAQQRNKPTQSC
jgi:hypothetical protein